MWPLPKRRRLIRTRPRNAVGVDIKDNVLRTHITSSSIFLLLPQPAPTFHSRSFLHIVHAQLPHDSCQCLFVRLFERRFERFIFPPEHLIEAELIFFLSLLFISEFSRAFRSRSSPRVELELVSRSRLEHHCCRPLQGCSAATKSLSLSLVAHRRTQEHERCHVKIEWMYRVCVCVK